MPEEEIIRPLESPESVVVTEQVTEQLEEDEGDGLEDLFSVTEEDVMGSGGEDLSDLTDVSEEDVMGSKDGDLSDLVDVTNEVEVSRGEVIGGGDADMSDDVLESYSEDDMSDLVDVSNDDLMGTTPQPKPKYKIAPRGNSVIRRFPPPPTMGGIK